MSNETTPLLNTSSESQSDNPENHEVSAGQSNKNSTYPLKESEENNEGKIQGKRKIDLIEDVNQL
ncbi:12933_t:CDS:2 [Acaulospora morrowiae]|uniref:12933_t:CDS:1 n=1 Tax=Acaulospora morrowiae TaxID=94023 RepID=A0A9N9GQ16_9GLOM|nr:12933_t:CDS:2 [Acaulospora morrowiae]